MAGKPVGTIFAELALDSTKLEQGLKKTNEALTSGTIKVEDAYKSLGIKSDAVYEAMRRNATAAVDFIKNKTISSTEEIARAQEAAANRIKQINEQQFGHQTTLLENMKKNYVAVGAAIAAAYIAINKAVSWADIGAKAQQAEESFRIVTQNMGVDTDKFLAHLKRASAGTVDDSDIMQRAIKGMTLGLSENKIVGIMETARVSARVAGTDVKEAYEDITNAIATGLPRSLRRYGLITKEEMAIVNQALKAGIDNVDLYTVAMMNAGIQAERMGKMHKNAAENLQAFHAQVKEIRESIGKATIAVAEYTLAGVKGWLAFAARAAHGIAEIISMLPGTIGEAGKAAMVRLDELNQKWLKDRAALLGIKTDAEKKEAAAANAGTAERISAAEREKKAWLDKLKAQIDAAKHAKDAHRDEMEILKANLAAGQAAYEMAVKTAEATAQASQDAGRNELSTIDELFDAKARAANAWLDIRLRTAEQEVAYEAKYAKVAYDADAVLLAKKKAIFADYDKTWNDAELKRAQATTEYAKRSAVAEAALYRSINEFSKETRDADIAALDAKYRELSRWTKNALLLQAAYERDRLMIIARSAAGEAEIRRKYTEDVKGPFSKAYQKAFAAALDAQADLEALKVGASFDRQAWLTAKNNEELQKRLSAEADFYSTIEGYEQAWFAKKVELINKERDLRIAAGMDAAAANAAANQAVGKARVELFDKEHKGINEILSATKGAAQTAISVFKEGSRERKIAHDIEMAATFAELMIQAQKNIMIATGAIANQGNGDPYTAFARIAAMIGLMANVLAMAGIAFGGGGGGASAPALPPSEVLGGAAGTKSESVDKIWKLLDDTYDLEYRELTGIHRAVQDLNTNLTGLMNSVVRGGGDYTASTFGVELGKQPGGLGDFMADNVIGFWNGLTKIMSLGFIEQLPGNNFLRSTLGKIFGGSVETSLQSSGLEYRGASVGELIAGRYMGAVSFALIKKVEDGGWFHSDSTSYQRLYTQLSGDTQRLFALVFKNMGETLLEVGKAFGVDTQKILAYVFKGATIEMMGKTGDEIGKILMEHISKVGDEAVKALFGDIVTKYQQVNEGLLETAVRLVVEMGVVQATLDMTGQHFNGTKLQLIDLSEALVNFAGGMEKLQEVAGVYYDKFFTDAEHTARTYEMLTGYFSDMNQMFPDTRAGYRDMVEGIDLSTEAGRQQYIMMLNLSGAADEYYTAMGDVLEVQGKLTASLTKQSDMIKKWIIDLNLSTLAPVTSMEARRYEYERQKTLASASGATEQDVSAFLNYAKDYLSFMRSYGGDYQAVYDSVVGDVERLGEIKDAQIAAIVAADNAAREAAARQLEMTGILVNAIVPNANESVADIIARGDTSSLGDRVIPNPSPRRAGGGITDGLTIAGEAGREWIVPTYEPQRSRFLESAPPQFWENLRGGGVVQPNSGGDLTVKAYFILNEKVVGEAVTRQIPRNANLAEAIRKVN